MREKGGWRGIPRYTVLNFWISLTYLYALKYSLVVRSINYRRISYTLGRRNNANLSTGITLELVKNSYEDLRILTYKNVIQFVNAVQRHGIIRFTYTRERHDVSTTRFKWCQEREFILNLNGVLMVPACGLTEYAADVVTSSGYRCLMFWTTQRD